jgi:hypothetical protein
VSQVKLLAAVAALGGLGVAYQRYWADLPRGYRNNNPGNLRENAHADDDWQGEAFIDWDPAFEEFRDPASGYRALAVVLRNYVRRHRLTTIRGIIGRYAPATENPTDTYVKNVARWTGMSADTSLRWDQPGLLLPLVKAITQMENGFLLHSDDVITARWEFA